MGDKQVVWDPEDEAEVTRAEHEFIALRDAGFHIYHDGKAQAKFAKTHGHFLATVEPLAFPDKEPAPKASSKAAAKKED